MYTFKALKYFLKYLTMFATFFYYKTFETKSCGTNHISVDSLLLNGLKFLKKHLKNFFFDKFYFVLQAARTAKYKDESESSDSEEWDEEENPDNMNVPGKFKTIVKIF